MRTLLAALAALCAAARATDTPEDPLRNLRPGHPRLIADAAAFAAIPERAKSDPVHAAALAQVLAKAEKDLGAPVTRHEIPDGLRLLASSRAVLARVERLGLAWRVTKDRRFADRAWSELQAAAGWPDWNAARHFLDTAELCRAFGIGYDWLYDAWTPEQRAILRAALIRHGLTPALSTYEGKGPGHFQRATNNWNQVCNAGVAMGALAIAEEEPGLARRIIRHALASLPISTRLYADDGSWDEGYGYFNYGTSYLIALIASLEASTGSDRGLGAIRGLRGMADFPCALEGPTGRIFNFADIGGAAKGESMPQVGWLATRFRQASAANLQRRHAAARPSPLDVLWLPAAQADSTGSRALRFAANAVCTLRTAWGEPSAGFVGFKAGDNRASHGHLDIGTFVYDADGVRWACDLGGDDYNLPGYFGQGRWDYYRLRAEGHNTLALAGRPGPDQNPKADCQLTVCREILGGGLAIADLTSALTGLAQARRGVRLAGDRSLRVQDELMPGKAATDLVWSMQTEAKVTVDPDGRGATLRRDRKQLRIRLVAPATARLECVEARTLPPRVAREGENPNAGKSRLIIRLAVDKPTTLAVDLLPEDATATPSAPVRPLSAW